MKGRPTGPLRTWPLVPEGVSEEATSLSHQAATRRAPWPGLPLRASGPRIPVAFGPARGASLNPARRYGGPCAAVALIGQ